MWSVKDIVDSGVIALKLTDTVLFAKELMLDQQLLHLPIIVEGKIEGIVSLTDLDNQGDEETINNIQRAVDSSYFVYEHEHYFEALKRLMAQPKLLSICVVDKDGKYQGEARLRALCANYVPQNYLAHEASLVVLEMDDFDYSLTNIANIVEYNRCKVLQVVSISAGNKKIWVQLIINSTTVQSIIKGFERYGYLVLYSQNQEGEAIIDERYQSLLKYLDL